MGWPAQLLRTCQEGALQLPTCRAMKALGRPQPAPPRVPTCGLAPLHLSLTCISSAGPRGGWGGKPATRTWFSVKSCDNEWLKIV